MATHDWQALAAALDDELSLDTPPIAITFTTSDAAPQGVERYAGATPEPTPDGRTGKVSAGCVFWMKAVDRTFHTCAEDHGNCSVGSLTHGGLLFGAGAGLLGGGRGGFLLGFLGFQLLHG